LVVQAVRVAHHDRDVVAGEADVAVDEQLAAGFGDVPAHRLEQLCRRADVPADGADIRFDDTQCDLHMPPPKCCRSSRGCDGGARRGCGPCPRAVSDTRAPRDMCPRMWPRSAFWSLSVCCACAPPRALELGGGLWAVRARRASSRTSEFRSR